MITILIIIAVIAIIGSAMPDKKDKKQVREEIEKLPRIFFRGKKMSGLEKFANLAYDDRKILKSFLYDSGFAIYFFSSKKHGCNSHVFQTIFNDFFHFLPSI